MWQGEVKITNKEFFKKTLLKFQTLPENKRVLTKVGYKF